MDKNKRRPLKDLGLRCYVDEFDKLVACDSEIRGLMISGQSIPPTLMLEYFMYLRRPNQEVYDTIFMHFEDISNFIKKRLVKGNIEKWKLLNESVITLFWGLSEEKSYSKSLSSKKEFIPTAYCHIKKFLDLRKAKPVTDYHLMVLTGFIATKFEFLATEEEFKKQPRTYGYYTAFLHQSVKHLAKSAYKP